MFFEVFVRIHPSRVLTFQALSISMFRGQDLGHSYLMVLLVRRRIH